MKKDTCLQCAGLAYIKGYCYQHYQLNKYHERKRRFGDAWDHQHDRICGGVNINTRNNGGYISYNNSMYHITPIQIMWLRSRGGRTAEDVVVQNNQLYVVMRKLRSDVLIEVPEDKYILKEYNLEKISRALTVLRCKK